MLTLLLRTLRPWRTIFIILIVAAVTGNPAAAKATRSKLGLPADACNLSGFCTYQMTYRAHSNNYKGKYH
jgi:hypothetical protein